MGDEKHQLDKFKDAARELECDDDEANFRKKLGELVKNSKDGQKSETPGGP
ncbi:hypothetical protein [Qipengyuania sp. Mu-71]|jgi:chaperonin cofactor prefoldin|uniref:hypothetical protein n=1 Tax=Qipengyuania sp. Mu-71 TaxID=3121477 RepID=UPI002FE4C8BD